MLLDIDRSGLLVETSAAVFNIIHETQIYWKQILPILKWTQFSNSPTFVQPIRFSFCNSRYNFLLKSTYRDYVNDIKTKFQQTINGWQKLLHDLTDGYQYLFFQVANHNRQHWDSLTNGSMHRILRQCIYETKKWLKRKNDTREHLLSMYTWWRGLAVMRWSWST